MNNQQPAVISVFPDPQFAASVSSSLEPSSSSWSHLSVTGDAALRLLEAGQRLIRKLSEDAGSVRHNRAFEERLSFSETARSLLPVPDEG